MAHMNWLRLYSECESFIKGVESQEGVVHEVGIVGDYERVVLYKVTGDITGQPIKAKMDNLTHLHKVISIAATELYRRGVLR